MKRIITGVIASIAVLGLMSACSSDAKKSVSSGPTGGTLPSGGGGGTLAPGQTLPGGGTLAPGQTLPTLPPDFTISPIGTIGSDMSIPKEVIDQMITQFEAAGMKVDRTCFENLLKDEQLRKLIAENGTPSQEVIQKFVACFQT